MELGNDSKVSIRILLLVKKALVFILLFLADVVDTLNTKLHTEELKVQEKHMKALLD